MLGVDGVLEVLTNLAVAHKVDTSHRSTMARNQNDFLETSMALPTVVDINVVAENENLEKPLSRNGMSRTEEGEMLRRL